MGSGASCLCTHPHPHVHVHSADSVPFSECTYVGSVIIVYFHQTNLNGVLGSYMYMYMLCIMKSLLRHMRLNSNLGH